MFLKSETWNKHEENTNTNKIFLSIDFHSCKSFFSSSLEKKNEAKIQKKNKKLQQKLLMYFHAYIFYSFFGTLDYVAKIYEGVGFLIVATKIRFRGVGAKSIKNRKLVVHCCNTYYIKFHFDKSKIWTWTIFLKFPQNFSYSAEMWI